MPHSQGDPELVLGVLASAHLFGVEDAEVTASPTLIPVNRLARAKGRLAELLSPEERETLALITPMVVRLFMEAAAVELVMPVPVQLPPA